MSLLDKSPVGKKGRYDDNSNISGSQTSDKGGFKVIGELTDIDCPDQKSRGKISEEEGCQEHFLLRVQPTRLQRYRQLSLHPEQHRERRGGRQWSLPLVLPIRVREAFGRKVSGRIEET